MKLSVSSLLDSYAATLSARKNMPRVDRSTESSQKSSSFQREVPMPRDAEYIEVDGKKYLLNAPRGTYLNLLV